jgi:transposase-like protein
VCREYQIAETLFYQWRERLLDGGKQALANPREKTAEQAELDRLKRRVGQLERALGRKTYELEVGGGTLAGLGVSVRVARSRAVVAAGYQPAVVARCRDFSSGVVSTVWSSTSRRWTRRHQSRRRARRGGR